MTKPASIAVLVVMLGCSTHGASPSPQTPPAPPDARAIDAPPPDRVAAVAPTDGEYALQEHPDKNNACAHDSDCFVGGCASYACTADPHVIDPCLDAPARAPAGASCGCVAGQCIWWRRPGPR